MTRHHPESGEVVARVELPVTNVTRACFAGPELDELVITTAWHGVEADLPRQPLAGDVFSVKLQVPGLKEETYLG